jgi:hypothetical protein
MSHAGTHRTLALIVAAASLVSCKSWWGGDQQIIGYAEPVGPIHVNFTCVGVPSISLADANGTPAWTVRAKKKDPISWQVPANVTIDSIVSKDTIPLPLDPAGPQGGGPGIGYSSKVKDSNKPPTDYHYNIFATCNPGGSAPVLRLKIDPEMIIP